MTRTAALLALLSLSACASTRPEPGSRDLVVLVHGMGRSPLSMGALDVSLRRAGYRVLNVGYNSQRPSVAEIGAEVSAEVEAALEAEPAPRVHYVGHSLGTVVVRWIFEDGAPGTPGRAVFLAPPRPGRGVGGPARGLGRVGPPPNPRAPDDGRDRGRARAAPRPRGRRHRGRPRRQGVGRGDVPPRRGPRRRAVGPHGDHDAAPRAPDGQGLLGDGRPRGRGRRAVRGRPRGVATSRTAHPRGRLPAAGYRRRPRPRRSRPGARSSGRATPGAGTGAGAATPPTGS